MPLNCAHILNGLHMVQPLSHFQPSYQIVSLSLSDLRKFFIYSVSIIRSYGANQNARFCSLVTDRPIQPRPWLVFHVKTKNHFA